MENSSRSRSMEQQAQRTSRVSARGSSSGAALRAFLPSRASRLWASAGCKLLPTKRLERERLRQRLKKGYRTAADFDLPADLFKELRVSGGEKRRNPIRHTSYKVYRVLERNGLPVWSTAQAAAQNGRSGGNLKICHVEYMGKVQIAHTQKLYGMLVSTIIQCASALVSNHFKHWPSRPPRFLMGWWPHARRPFHGGFILKRNGKGEPVLGLVPAGAKSVQVAGAVCQKNELLLCGSCGEAQPQGADRQATKTFTSRKTQADVRGRELLRKEQDVPKWREQRAQMVRCCSCA